MTSNPPAAPSAPTAPAENRSPRATIPQAREISIASGPTSGSDRIVIYGTGGVGKSTLAAHLPAPLFVDIEDGTRKLNVSRVAASSWLELRGTLATLAVNPPEGLRSVVVDSATMAEELAREHVVEFKPTKEGRRVSSIEDYGWGKGWQFVYEEYLAVLADLDRIAANGMNVCLIAHQVSSPVPNPAGEDFIRWEPHLYSGDKKGRSSIRERVKEWADHVLFVGYDLSVKDGKGIGGGSRTIYTQELPTHIAKSRSVQLTTPFELERAGEVWQKLGIV